MSDTHVAWMFELLPRDGRDTDLDALMAEMVGATERNEPGTLDYEWFLSEDRRRVHLFERYVNSQAAMTHLVTFNERFMKRFFDILKPERMVVYGAPDEAVRDALSKLGPTVMPLAEGFSRRAAPTTAASAAANAAAAAASASAPTAPPG